MSTVVKDLGAVSAYAYSVEKGYTGTEEEFAELMASYADVGQTAVDAKDAAVAANTAAQTAATTATTKASEASQSASAAHTDAESADQSASQASTSAQTASTKASEASQSATTATEKATEATTAASNATTAKDDAETAKNAAETAQGKAETAQGAAEEAAESVSASAAQIATNTSDISELKSDLSDAKEEISDLEQAVFDVSKNVYDPNTEWVNGTFSNGNLVEKATGVDDAAEKDYIPVTANADWVISWKAVDLNCTMYVQTYDKDYNWLSQLTSITMNAVRRYGTFVTPDNCAFIRIRIYRNGATWNTIIPGEIQVELGLIPTEYQPKSKTSKFVAVDAELQNLQEQINQNPAIVQRRQVATNTNVLFPSVKGYLKDDGTFNTTANGWQRSDYISVEPNTFMYFHGVYAWGYFGFFDENKTWIGGKNIETPIVSDANYLIVHQVPVGASYMIVSFEDANVPTAWGNYLPVIPDGTVIYANNKTLRAYADYPQNPCDYSGLDVCAFRKGLCIGDSLTGGGFNYSSGTNPWADGNVYSYPAQFEKMTGIPMTNEGHSGRTTVQWWDQYGIGGDTAIDFSGYDFAIIHLGVNDVSYNVPTADTQAAYQNIINALKAANTGIKIFVCTIIPAYAIDGITAYDTINTLIKSFATQENVYCCDLTTYGHTYKNSQYAAGHLTAYGYWRMAKDIMAYISYIMRQHPADFRFIQYIGTDMQY